MLLVGIDLLVCFLGLIAFNTEFFQSIKPISITRGDEIITLSGTIFSDVFSVKVIAVYFIVRLGLLLLYIKGLGGEALALLFQCWYRVILSVLGILGFFGLLVPMGFIGISLLVVVVMTALYASMSFFRC